MGSTGKSPLGGKSDSDEATAALAQSRLCWPIKVQPHNLDPGKTREWESAFKQEIQAAVAIKLSQNETSKVPNALCNEVTIVDSSARGRQVQWIRYIRQDALGDKPSSESQIHARMESQLF